LEVPTISCKAYATVSQNITPKTLAQLVTSLMVVYTRHKSIFHYTSYACPTQPISAYLNPKTFPKLQNPPHLPIQVQLTAAKVLSQSALMLCNGRYLSLAESQDLIVQDSCRQETSHITSRPSMRAPTC
jgi:hypothetical protein